MEYSTPNPAKLVVFTNPYDLKNETEIINRLFAQGLDELHIRKPQMDKAGFEKYIQDIDPKYHNRLVLHDHYSLVHRFDINKIHISGKWNKNAFLKFMLDRFILKGKAVKKVTTVNACGALYGNQKGLDEVILGPVFATMTYHIANQLIKTDKLVKALSKSRIPVLGLGGVTLKNTDFFRTSGFGGIILQSSVWKTMDPIRSFIQIRDSYRSAEAELRIAV